VGSEEGAMSRQERTAGGFMRWLETLDCRGNGVLVEASEYERVVGKVCEDAAWSAVGLFFQVESGRQWEELRGRIRKEWEGTDVIIAGSCGWQPSEAGECGEGGGRVGVFVVCPRIYMMAFSKACLLGATPPGLSSCRPWLCPEVVADQLFVVSILEEEARALLGRECVLAGWKFQVWPWIDISGVYISGMEFLELNAEKQEVVGGGDTLGGAWDVLGMGKDSE
jgi:hypothetical protein